MSIRNRVAAVAARPLPKYDHGQCFHCNVDVPQKYFCWGCSRYVCNDCEKFSPEDQHKQEDHIHARPVPVRSLP